MSNFLIMNIHSFLILISISFLISIFFLVTKKAHINFSAKGHKGTEIQGLHENPTPRIGGISIFLSLLFYFIFFYESDSSIFKFLLISSFLKILIGMCEDFSWLIAPK